MIINEIFYSLQGEGFLAGTPSVFIRLAGCPLCCKWCDTRYAWDERAGGEYTTGEIVEALKKYKTKYVVITGGEPMTKPNLMAEAGLPELLRLLKASGKHITIETAGIAFAPDLPCDLMSISPKLSNSTPDDPTLAEIHNNSRLDTAVLAALLDGYNYQLKFVVDSPNDLEEINQTIETLGNVDLTKVMLMPQAQTRKELLIKSPVVADLCKRTGFAFCQRLQVLLWDNQRGL
jgi:7-carboxy-7-deazaguanine synthase